jgi:hypothetical protein
MARRVKAKASQMEYMSTTQKLKTQKQK